MPVDRQDIVEAALTEWERWGRQAWNLVTGAKRFGTRDDEPAFAQYVIDNYCAVVGDEPPLHAVQFDDYAWSAVGMSFFMKRAGLLKKEFPFSNRHADYIRHFVRARKKADEAALYWGFRHDEAGSEPDVGDLVGYARGEGMTQARARGLFDATQGYASHTDLVVARRPGEIDVLGANVADSVTLKTVPLNAAGRISDNQHFWFVVLKARF